MTLKLINENAVPAYTALSSDVVNGKIAGANLVGKLVYLTDTLAWYIIKDDLNLSTYTLPIDFSGGITIGTVTQGTAGVDPWLVEVDSTPGLTNTELRATPVPISGTVTTGGLTDTQLRATPVPVSTGGLTDAQLRATPVPISGSISTTAGSVIGIADGANLDAFSRLRVSSPKTIFQSSFQYNLQPVLFEQSTATGGTIAHSPNMSSALMTVTTTNGSSAIMQSRQYARYVPAKSQLIAITQVVGAATANTRKRIGYFDANNGIYLEQNGTTDLAIVRRTKVSGSIVENRVTQANWNLDKLNGLGASGLTLDLSKASIFIIDLQWLGMGRVRVGFDINGLIIYTHQFLNANVLATPYMQTGTLPIRWEMTNTGTSVGDIMYATCASVLSEGGDDSPESYSFSVSNNANISATTSRTPLLAIRPKTTFNGVENRISIDISDYGVLNGNNPVLVELIYNPTLSVTGGWTSADTESSIEYHRVITSITNGIVVSSGFLGAGQNSKEQLTKIVTSRYPITLDIAGANPIPVVVCATSTTLTSDCRASITWKELR